MKTLILGISNLIIFEFFMVDLNRNPRGVHYFFLGMGAVASTAAIGNVVTVEMTFEEWLRLGRSPNEGQETLGKP